MGLILALPILDFNIGSYSLNAYTYPAWSSFVLQLISTTLNVIFLRKVERDQPEPPKTTEKKKNIYISTGVVLILALFLYDGYFISVFAYTLPIVMIDGYGWYEGKT